MPGVNKTSKEVEAWIQSAIAADKPSANGTVITYQMGQRLVYLSNEAPVEGVYSRKSGEFFGWIAGVTDAEPAQRDAIAGAIAAHAGGGSAALEREVRKLQNSRDAPPSAEASI